MFLVMFFFLPIFLLLGVLSEDKMKSCLGNCKNEFEVPECQKTAEESVLHSSLSSLS